jgi:hypothetical protein
VVEEEDMKSVIDKLYKGYGDMAPFNKGGVDYGRLMAEGNGYLEDNFASIDYINSCKFVDSASGRKKAKVGLQTLCKHSAWSHRSPHTHITYILGGGIFGCARGGGHWQAWLY